MPRPRVLFSERTLIAPPCSLHALIAGLAGVTAHVGKATSVKTSFPSLCLRPCEQKVELNNLSGALNIPDSMFSKNYGCIC